MKKFFVLLCVFALVLTGCSSATGKLEKIKSKGEIVVYTDPNFAPFEFLGANSQIQGVDVEIAKAIAAELGVTVTFKEANFDSILMAVKGGKGDIAVSGFTITDERRKSVDFSIPYINSVQYLILPAGSNIKVLEDLADKSVGVALGYTGQFLIEDEMDKAKDGTEGVLYNQNVDLREYNSALEAVSDLKNGRIDAVVMDEYVAKNIVSKNPGLIAVELRYASGDLAAEEYGVVVPKGNEDLLEIINRVIQRLIDADKIQEWVVQYSV